MDYEDGRNALLQKSMKKCEKIKQQRSNIVMLLLYG